MGDVCVIIGAKVIKKREKESLSHPSPVGKG
jgi:hypothetical protein